VQQSNPFIDRSNNFPFSTICKHGHEIHVLDLSRSCGSVPKSQNAHFRGLASDVEDVERAHGTRRVVLCGLAHAVRTNVVPKSNSHGTSGDYRTSSVGFRPWWGGWHQSNTNQWTAGGKAARKLVVDTIEPRVHATGWSPVVHDDSVLHSGIVVVDVAPVCTALIQQPSLW